MTKMTGYNHDAFTDVEFSVAMTEAIDQTLSKHLDKGFDQEDLTFAYWRPSHGRRRYTAILSEIALPRDQDRVMDGNVAFTAKYLKRVLRETPDGCGIALLHSHLGPGWQNMSMDDVVAERDRMGGAVAARTGLPILGLTRGTDGAWSARIWLRIGRNQYQRRWAQTVRVVGKRLRITHHPELSPEPLSNSRQVATASVWGNAAQSEIVRCHVGIVGLGSVGSIVSESLSRMGIQRLTLIDHDRVEDRNLDRMMGALIDDSRNSVPKVAVAHRGAIQSHTSDDFSTTQVFGDLLTELGMSSALDCDALISCVDRPLPRHILNVISKAHLIPVIDGGIYARVNRAGLPVHVDWRIHTVGPELSCLFCLGRLRRSDVALDREGWLDNPDYIANLPPEDRDNGRRNVFAFSLAVASHETLQFVKLVTGMERVGGVGPQHYSAFPGRMEVVETTTCDEDCDIDALTSTALDLSSNIIDRPSEILASESAKDLRPFRRVKAWLRSLNRRNI